jgi:hypothetical protein
MFEDSDDDRTAPRASLAPWYAPYVFFALSVALLATWLLLSVV